MPIGGMGEQHHVRYAFERPDYVTYELAEHHEKAILRITSYPAIDTQWILVREATTKL